MPGLTEAKWHFEVVAPQCACQFRDLKLTGPETKVLMALQPGGEISGRILDDQGQPLAGASVGIRPENQVMYNLDLVKTNERGEYHLQYLPLHVPLKLDFSHDEFTRQSNIVSVDNGAPVDRGTTRLSRLPDGGKLNGQIVDDAAHPIAGATLENSGTSSSNKSIAQSDADGHFHIEKLFVGLYDEVKLIVRAAGFAPQEVLVPKAQRAGAEPLKITLHPGHRIRGRVVNEAGDPVRARIFFAGGRHGPDGIGGQIETDREGRFESNSLPPACEFEIHASGCSMLDNQRLPLDQEDEVVVRLEPIGLIRGQVLNAATEQAIKKFNVRLGFLSDRQLGDKEPRGIEYTRMDPGEDFASMDGRFELPSLTNGCFVDLVVRAQGYHPLRLVRVHAASPSNAKTAIARLEPIRPGEETVVKGRIIAPDGRPAAGVQVRLMGLDKQRTSPTSEDFSWPAVESGSIAHNAACYEFRSAVTNGEGAFVFQDVPLWLALRLAYWSDTVPEARIDNLENKSPEDLARLQFTHVEPVTVRGTIDRRVFPDAAAVAFGDFRRSRHRQLDLKEGQTDFEFQGVHAGSVRISLQDKGQPGPRGTGIVSSIGSAKIVTKPGETVTVDFDEKTRRQ